MTDTLREAVARAICWKNGMNPDLTLGGDGENYLWMEYEAQADAALAAMIEVGPTEAMIEAGRDALMKCNMKVGDLRSQKESEAVVAFSAMLRAAKEEGDE